jgi:hypothetical protein
MRKYLDFLALIAVFELVGCASLELNYNTLDLASTTDDLMMQQVYHNLANFVDSDLAYPTQLVINSGAATTSDMVSANYTDPLSTAVQTTSQLVSTVAGASTQTTNTLAKAVSTGSSGTTNTSTNAVQVTVPNGASLATTTGSQYSRASSSLGLGAQDVRSELWSYQPVTDAFRARRLMALYRFVVNSSTPGLGKDSERNLRTDYPEIHQTVNHSENDCLEDSTGNPIIAQNLAIPAIARGLALNGAYNADKSATQSAAAAAAALKVAQSASSAATAVAAADPKNLNMANVAKAADAVLAASKTAADAASALTKDRTTYSAVDDAAKAVKAAAAAVGAAQAAATAAQNAATADPKNIDIANVALAAAGALKAAQAASTAATTASADVNTAATEITIAAKADAAKTAAAKAAAALLLFQQNTALAKGVTNVSLPSFSRCITSVSETGGGPAMTQGTQTYSTMQVDEYYRRGPSCVICGERKKVNTDLSGGWLHWRALPGAPESRKPDNYGPGDTSLGIHGHYEFFVAHGQGQKMPKFALFILAAATQSDTGSAGSAVAAGASSGGSGGGGGQGQGNPNPLTLFGNGTNNQFIVQ